MKTIGAMMLLTLCLLGCGCGIHDFLKPSKVPSDTLCPLTVPFHYLFSNRSLMPLTKSLRDSENNHREAFQSIDEAYHLDGDCVIVFSTIKIKTHEPRTHWFQATPVELSPKTDPENVSIEIPAKQIREGRLPSDIADLARPIPLLRDSNEVVSLPQETKEDDMTVVARPREKSFTLFWSKGGVPQSTEYRFHVPNARKPSAKLATALAYPFTVAVDSGRLVTLGVLYTLFRIATSFPP